MIRTAFVRCSSVAAAVLLLAGGAGAATVGLLPSQSGDSVVYQFDVDGAHPSLGQLWVVRSNASRLSVTISPAMDSPGSFAFDVFANGGVRAAGNESPVEPSAVAIEMARNFASAVNLAAPVAASTRSENWNIEVPTPGEGGVMNLIARMASSSGADRTAVADGTGTITLPAGPPDKRGRKPAPVQADVWVHIESQIKAGTLAGASGTVQVTSREKVPKKSQYSWTLALNGR